MSDEKFGWALYQVNRSKRKFEIDVEPVMVREERIIKLIFTTNFVPKVSQLTSDLYIDHERWRVTWDKGEGMTMMKSLRGPFQNFLLKHTAYGRNWRERARRERIDMQMREIESAIWRAVPQKRFGGRSPNDLIALGEGPYEVSGQGFVYVTSHSIQYHPYFKYKKINERIRWYLERGTDLSEAIGLEVRQSKRVNAQMIAGFAIAMADNVGQVGSGKEGAWNIKNVNVVQLLELLGLGASFEWSPTPSHRHALSAAITEHFESHPDERRIQELDKKRTVKITQL